MKKLLLIMTAALLCACQTTDAPPQWWNPSGKYVAPIAAAAPQAQSAPQAAEKEPMPEPAYETTFPPVTAEKVEIIQLEAPSVLTEE